MGNLAPSLTDQELRQLFQRYGTVQDVKLYRKGSYAFVHFQTHQSAVNAIIGMNGKVSTKPIVDKSHIYVFIPRLLLDLVVHIAYRYTGLQHLQADRKYNMQLCKVTPLFQLCLSLALWRNINWCACYRLTHDSGQLLLWLYVCIAVCCTNVLLRTAGDWSYVTPCVTIRLYKCSLHCSESSWSVILRGSNLERN